MPPDQPLLIEQRCQPNGVACIEVTARVAAGHRVKYIEGCAEHGEELLVKAAQIAEVHLDEHRLREAE